MALTDSFYEAVKSGNLRRVRIMMKDSLLVDPSFREFEQMEKAAQGMYGLYDTHDGRKFIYDSSEWNDDYMNKVMVQVVGNFSHERIEHLKEVVRYLRPVSESAGSVASDRRKAPKHTEYSDSEDCGNFDYQQQKHKDMQNGTYIGTATTVGAVAGAAVGGVIAHLAGATVFGGVAIGVVVGGVAGAVIGNGRK